MHREVKEVAQGHPGAEWQSQAMKLGSRPPNLCSRPPNLLVVKHLPQKSSHGKIQCVTEQSRDALVQVQTAKPYCSSPPVPVFKSPI